MLLGNMDKLHELGGTGMGAQLDHGRLRRFDVTSTTAYKELYANNLRMHSFLMKKELDRRSQMKLQSRKEEYFQNHVTNQNNQRNNQLMKSFRQMSRMRNCLSNPDLRKPSASNVDDSSPRNEGECAKQSPMKGAGPDDVISRSKPRSKSSIGAFHSATSSIEKDQENLRKSNYLLVPESVENPVSPSASLTSSVSIGAAQSMTSGSSKQAQMSGNRRRRFSDVGVQRLPEPDVSFYNGRSYCDTEDQIQKVRVEMNQEKSTKSSHLLVPEAEKVTSPADTPTTSISIILTPSISHTSPSKMTNATGNRRRHSDLGVQRLPEPDVNSNNDHVHSDSEAQNQENEDTGRTSPSTIRARTARIRQEYRKARMASLEDKITQASFILNEIRKKSLPHEISEETKQNSLEHRNENNYLPSSFNL